MYTLEVYKKDRRCKSGERLYLKEDYAVKDASMLSHTVTHTWLPSQGFRWELHETYVTKKNLMSGVEYKERYDTPYYCSPSSETYWST